MKYLFGTEKGMLYVVIRFGKDGMKAHSIDPIEPILKMISEKHTLPNAMTLRPNTIENAAYVLTKLGYEVDGDVPQYPSQKGVVY